MPTVSVRPKTEPTTRVSPRALTGLAAIVLVIAVAAIAYFQWLGS